ncbi:hypothetical protein K1T71_004504 [Dendrolimus kikuchii]|uniref:Uncharacterized protein n=1 Tax=Dendrolimus kikuchii TaxID=765133 RepID=A0ACC1D7L4_9NEOP|nr:hypothetical protein K1T71_004504 [Dendrolimus kikuchii]
MKLLFVLCAISLAAASAPPPGVYSDKAEVVKYENDNPGFGGYRYEFKQTDGTEQEQSGVIKNEGSKDESLAVRGSFSWVGPDGVKYTVTYVADEGGYQPEIEQGPGGGVRLEIILYGG